MHQPSSFIRQPFRRPWALSLLLIAVLSAATGGFLYHQHHRYKHFAVHEPGKVYRSGWVEADVMGELVRTYGIRTVINLCRPGEMGPTRAAEERRAVESAGGRFLELPMPETADPRDSRIASHIEVLTNADNYPLLIHCQHGVNRTARTLAMYEVLVRHADGEAAVRRMPRFGRRNYEPLEYEFARNFTAAYLRTSPETADAEPESRR